jgi:hypothetical protein
MEFKPVNPSRRQLADKVARRALDAECAGGAMRKPTIAENIDTGKKSRADPEPSLNASVTATRIA